MKKYFYMLIMTFLVLLIVGCTNAQPEIQVKPSIEIHKTTKEKVIDKIVYRSSEKGATIKNITDYGLTVEQKVNNSAMASFLYGSKYDSTPVLRLSYSIVNINKGVKLFVRAEMVTNPGSAYERTNDVTNSISKALNKLLNDIKTQVHSQ